MNDIGTLRNDDATFERLRAEGWQQQKDAAFLTLIGPVWFRERDGARDFGILMQPKHENTRGVVQGGVLMTLLDRSLGATGRIATGGLPHATAQLDVHFIDAVRIGDFVEARCRVLRRTRSLIYLAGELWVGERVVLNGIGVWKILGDGKPQATVSPSDKSEPAS